MKKIIEDFYQTLYNGKDLDKIKKINIQRNIFKRKQQQQNKERQCIKKFQFKK